MSIKIGEEERTVTNGFVEIDYFAGNVISIYNDEFSSQSISNDITVSLANKSSINLSTKDIYLDDVKKLNLDQMSIDSSDNVVIKSDEESTEVKDNTDTTNNDSTNNNTTDNSSNLTNPINPFLVLSNGVIDVDNTETEVTTTISVKEPSFTITDMIVSATSLQASVSIIDSNSLLKGDFTVKVIEANTSKVVYNHTEASGSSTLDIEVNNLTTATNYILIVNSNYIKNNLEYSKDFIQKTFVTLDVGISVEKDYLTSNAISLNVLKDETSSVLGMDVCLYDQDDNLLSTNNVSFTSDATKQSVNTIFNYLDSNKVYKIVVKNYIFKNQIINDAISINKNFKTLKEKPTLGKPSFTIDKKNSKFNLNMVNIKDTDNGITSYRYDIYDSKDLNTVIKSIEKKDATNASVIVDDLTIYRNSPYVFKIVTTFNDNEKEYEYESSYSDVMKMDGVAYPTIRFTSSNITFERIEGTLYIDDKENTIDLTSPLQITYTDSVGVSKTITTTGNDGLTIPISVNNLRANETYTFSDFGKIDLQDGNLPIDNCHIGSVVVKTK